MSCVDVGVCDERATARRWTPFSTLLGCMLHASPLVLRSCGGFVTYFSIASQSGCLALAGRVEQKTLCFDATCLSIALFDASGKATTTSPLALGREARWFLPTGLSVSVMLTDDDACEVHLPAACAPTLPQVRIFVMPPCLLTHHDGNVIGDVPFVALPPNTEATRSCMVAPASWQAWRRGVKQLEDSRPSFSAAVPVISRDEENIARWWNGDAASSNERSASVTINSLDTSDLLTNLL